eukprot:gene16468-19268_t
MSGLYMSACSPDDKMGMAASSFTEKAGTTFDATTIQPVDNVGVKFRVAYGPATLPTHGVGAAAVGGTYVSAASGTIQLPDGKNNAAFHRLGHTGAPCEACGLCDWEPRVVADAMPLKRATSTLADVHSWFECKKACCMDSGCASAQWDSAKLSCMLYDESHKVLDPSSATRPAADDDERCMRGGCVSDKVWHWEPTVSGVTHASVLEQVSGVKSLEDCKHACKKRGMKCKAVTWYGDF